MLFSCSFAFGQTDVKRADELFESGDYMGAKTLYVAYVKKDKSVAEKYEHSQTCFSYMQLANESFESQKYNSSIRYCELVLEINPKDQNAKDLKTRSLNGIEQLRIQRDQLLETARRECSESLLNEFKTKYSKQTEQVEKADRILADLPLWKKAKSVGSESDYETYLQTTVYNSYFEEAKFEILKIHAEDRWQELRKSKSADELLDYVLKYSSTNLHMNEALPRLYLYKARSFYAKQNYDSSYFYYPRARVLSEFTKKDLKELMYANEVVDYNHCMTTRASISDLEKFMTEFPKSKFTKEVSSKLACLLADNLSRKSTKSSVKRVKKFAKTQDSKLYVKNKIKSLGL